MDRTIKHNVKDSIFTFIFQDAKNRRELYLALHPEDTDVTEEECELVTLQNVLLTGIFNDLGILVRDTLIILMEAQSTFTLNITLRILIYLAKTYKEYVEEHKYNLYGTKPVSIPRPELYMVYVGEPRELPEELRLSDLYGGNGDVELKVRVLRDSGEKNILDQYIRMCGICGEQRKKHGKSEDAANGILRACFEEGILTPFLEKWEREVRDIMITLFDQEYATRMFEWEAEERGQRTGYANALRDLMASTGWPLEKALTALNVPEPDRRTYREMLREQ